MISTIFIIKFQVVNSLLSVKPDFLESILSDSKGSYIADAFAASPFVGQKSHEKLTKHLLVSNEICELTDVLGASLFFTIDQQLVLSDC